MAEPSSSIPLPESFINIPVEPSLSSATSTSTSDDPLSISLHSMLTSSPSSHDGADPATVIMSSGIQQTWDEYLKLYNCGIPYLARHQEQFDRLCALLISLADQSSISPSLLCFVETLSSHLSSFLSRQQSLHAEFLSLDQHFDHVDQVKKIIPEVTTPITNARREDQSLADQESALQQRILALKEELAIAEVTLARTSERRLLLQDQLKFKRDEGLKIRDQLSQLYKVHPLMKRKKKAAENAQANLIAEWNQLKDLLS